MTVGTDVALIKDHVDNQTGIQNERATNAINEAHGFLQKLEEAATYIPEAFPDSEPVSLALQTPLLAAAAPFTPVTAINDIKATIPAQPDDFNASVADRDVQSVPQENFSTPNVSFPNAPVYSAETKPSKETISLPGGVPDTPTVSVPNDLTVSTQTVPSIPSISVPSFGESLPVLNIDLPGTTLAYVEPVYTSALKTALASALLNGVNDGGTGLGVTVQTAIWNQDIERLAQQKDDDIEEVLNKFAGRGFDIPTGMVAQQVNEVLKNFTNDRSQNSRTIAIEEAKLAKEMTQFFLSTGLSLEQIELNHANNIANRALEAEKSVVQFSIALFNSKVQEFNTQLARYQSKVSEVDANIKIQGLILDQYRAELSGVSVVSEKDKISIDNFKAKLDSHNAVVNLYEAETSAVKTSLDIERAKMDIFKVDIDDYVARLGAQKNEYDLYLAEVQGEKSKIDLHRADVEAYVARVNGVKISNDVVIAQINSDIAIEELNLKSYLANVDKWKEKSQLAIQELGIEERFFSANIQRYRAEVSREVAQNTLNVEAAIKVSNLEVANSNIQLQRAIAENNSVIEQARARIIAAQGAADGYTALATVAAGVIQTMLQLGGQGTSVETTTS